MKQTQKPTYNMWQNTAFMLGNAWRSYKSVPLLCVGIAASAAGAVAVAASASAAETAPTVSVAATAVMSGRNRENMFFIGLFSCFFWTVKGCGPRGTGVPFW